MVAFMTYYELEERYGGAIAQFLIDEMEKVAASDDAADATQSMVA